MIELNLQYLTNSLTTLVKIKGALVSPNDNCKNEKLYVTFEYPGKTEKLLMRFENINVVITAL